MGDLPEVIADRLVCLGMDLDDTIREALNRFAPTTNPLPVDERGRALDVRGLPVWPCCRRRGVHAVWCRWAVPYVGRAAPRPPEGH